MKLSYVCVLLWCFVVGLVSGQASDGEVSKQGQFSDPSNCTGDGCIVIKTV